MVVQINEASQPVHNTFPASFSQARNNVLHRTVTISLMIRQQLELLWDRVRCEKPLLLWHWCQAAPPASCWVVSIRICLHTLRTTSCSASSSCCCCLRVQLQPTRGHHRPRRNLLQVSGRFDKVTPPCPPTGAMILLKKSVLFLNFSCKMPKRPISSFATFCQASRIFSGVHSFLFLCILLGTLPSCHALLRCSFSRIGWCATSLIHIPLKRPSTVVFPRLSCS